MKKYIVINRKIYDKYKAEIHSLDIRFFCDDYFYNLANYSVPFELISLKEYIHYVDEIELFSTASFIDFINILLVLSYLKSIDFKGNVIIGYYMLSKDNLKDAIYTKSVLSSEDYKQIDGLLDEIKNNKKTTTRNIRLVGIDSYLNFLDMLNDSEKFLLNIEEIIDEFDEDINEIANYLESKYSNMGLSKEFYLTYLEKYM